MLERMWRKGNLLHSWWEYKLIQPLWRRVRRFLYKQKIESPYDLAIPFLGVYKERMKALIWKDTCAPMFVAALFTIVETWKQLKCPLTDEWIKMYLYPYTYTYTYTVEYYSSSQKEWDNDICSNMDGPIDQHTKWRKSDKGKCLMISLICRI